MPYGYRVGVRDDQYVAFALGESPELLRQLLVIDDGGLDRRRCHQCPRLTGYRPRGRVTRECVLEFERGFHVFEASVGGKSVDLTRYRL